MRIIPLLLAAIGLTAVAPAAAADDPAARAAIVAIVADEDAAWNVGDAAAYSARVAPEVIFTNIVGMYAVGRAAFEAQHARIFTTIYKGSTLHQTVEHIAFVRPDVAIVDTVSAVTGFATLPPGITAIDGALRTQLEQVMVRDGDRWSIAAYHNVAINPAALAGRPPPK